MLIKFIYRFIHIDILYFIINDLNERKNKMFCSSCGKNISDTSKFCEYCGSQITNNTQIFSNPVQQYYEQPSQQIINKQSEKSMLGLLIGIIGISVITLISIILFILFKTGILGWIISLTVLAAAFFISILFSKKGIIFPVVSILISAIITGCVFFLTTNISMLPTGTTDTTISSIVSKGVNTDDLGNIMNGQYFFDDGTNQYYSSFDTTPASHMYKELKNSAASSSIFDGFGWSLVVKDDWIYFSGNQGTVIDGTYNLFRIKTDGSQLQTLNTGYCYGMNVYNNWIYYIKKPDMNSLQSDIYRCGFDGSNETVIVSGNITYFVVYENKLYYLNTGGQLYKADPDGSNAEIINTELMNKFIIGNGKIIFLSTSGSIKTVDADGSDIKEIRPADGSIIGSINSYKGTIFYTIYDQNFDYTLYAYKYYLYSMDFNGSNNKQIYQSYSWGFYVNILNDKVFMLDYTKDSASGIQTAITKNMNLDGSGIQELSR